MDWVMSFVRDCLTVLAMFVICDVVDYFFFSRSSIIADWWKERNKDK